MQLLNLDRNGRSENRRRAAHGQKVICRSKVPSFEYIFDRDKPLHPFIIARHSHVCTRAVFAVHHHCPGKSLACPVLRRFVL